MNNATSGAQKTLSPPLHPPALSYGVGKVSTTDGSRTPRARYRDAPRIVSTIAS
jgi:hypothetical protein